MSEAITSDEAEMRERTPVAFYKWFFFTSGAILAITGIAKIWSGLGSSKLLAVVDPIIGIKFGTLMMVVGVAEIVIAAVCFFSKRQTLALGLVAWMSTNFVVYRLGLWWMDWRKPCSCLGNLTDALHITPQTADNIMKVLLAYLIIGSYGLLFWRWRLSKKLLLLFWGVMFNASVITCNAAPGEAFEIHGKLTVTSLNSDGTTFKSGTYGFNVITDRERWLIKAIYGSNHEQTFGYDGTNTYSLLLDPNLIESPFLPGVIAGHPYPPAATWHVTIPWLAFCSQIFFKNSGSKTANIPAPWIPATQDPSAHTYIARWLHFDENFGIPTNINFVVEQSLIQKSQTNTLLYMRERPNEINRNPAVLEALNSQNPTTATYHVLSATNVSGVNLPQEFELVVYEENVKKKQSRKPKLQMHGKVESVTVVKTVNFIPQWCSGWWKLLLRWFVF